MSILIGDIGGTWVRIRVVEPTAKGPEVQHDLRRPSRNFESLAAALTTGLSDLPPNTRERIDRACLAVAGPVEAGRVRFTNLHWDDDEASLADAIGVRRLKLVNDLEALAYGIAALPDADLAAVREVPAHAGRRAVVSVGTGLGVALLSGAGRELRVYGTEAGHSDFAPADERQAGLWRWLRDRYGHVSYERLLSGAGLAKIHQFLRGGAAGPGVDAPAVVKRAREDGDPHARAAVEMFASVLGAFAGNIVLHWLATGGVILSGSVAAAVMPELRADAFERAFLDKGRLWRVLDPVPVRLADTPDAGLVGALHIADGTVD